MNQADLIRRAWNITWRYRVLWIFGILLALTSGGGSSWQTSRSEVNSFTAGQGIGNLGNSGAVALILFFCCLVLLLIVALAIVRYVARAALYRSVDSIEDTGTAPSWRTGFRLGWTNRTFRLFLLDLLVGIPFALAVILLIGMAALPVLLLVNSELRVLGIIMTVSLGLLVLGILLAAGAVIGVLSQFWSREIVLRDMSIGHAFAAGYALARRNFGQVAVLWLIMFAIGLGVFAVSFLLIAAIGLVGGGFAFALGTVLHARFLSAIMWGIVVLLILIVPVCIVQGLYLTWESSVWTLAYRQLMGTSATAAAATPAEDAPAVP